MAAAAPQVAPAAAATAATTGTLGTATAGAHKLTELLALARAARGAAAAAVIQQALEHPAVFTFGELLASPNIAALAGTEHEPALTLLQLFAYGVYADYAANAASLPPLTPAQLRKLQMLTLVSLSYQSKILPYADLLKTLDLPNLRALEGLVIAAIYAGVVRAKLNQASRVVEVEAAMGRDVRPSDLAAMIATLARWYDQTTQLVAMVDARIADVGKSMTSAEQERQDLDASVERVRQRLSKRSLGGSLSEDARRDGDFSSQEYHDEDSRGRGKGRHKVARAGPAPGGRRAPRA